MEIESSSGSDSTSSSYDSDGSAPDLLTQGTTELVPQGKEFYRHVKSGIVHKCKLDVLVSSCNPFLLECGRFSSEDRFNTEHKEER